ncbi:hypothetical protein [Desulfococcus sp.]|jgi:hypothetical protein|uniref:hypothetical protein n=1 Tax=Desulfococcus sp. TaxID=2025834 RepID=UPI003D107940
MQLIEGKTSRDLLSENRAPVKKFRVVICGLAAISQEYQAMTDHVIAEYTELQNGHERVEPETGDPPPEHYALHYLPSCRGITGRFAKRPCFWLMFMSISRDIGRIHP